MRLKHIVSSGQYSRLEGLFPGLDLDDVEIRRIPGPVAMRMRWVEAVTLGRTVWIRGEGSDLPALLAHELTHVLQWRVMGALGFALRYLGDYCRARLGGLDHVAAYRAIPAERDARAAARLFAGRLD